MPIDLKLYPVNWKRISFLIRYRRAGGRCEWCGAEHGRAHPDTGSRVIFTTAHLGGFCNRSIQTRQDGHTQRGSCLSLSEVPFELRPDRPHSQASRESRIEASGNRASAFMIGNGEKAPEIPQPERTVKPKPAKQQRARQGEPDPLETLSDEQLFCPSRSTPAFLENRAEK